MLLAAVISAGRAMAEERLDDLTPPPALLGQRSLDDAGRTLRSVVGLRRAAPFPESVATFHIYLLNSEGAARWLVSAAAPPRGGKCTDVALVAFSVLRTGQHFYPEIASKPNVSTACLDSSIVVGITNAIRPMVLAASFSGSPPSGLDGDRYCFLSFVYGHGFLEGDTSNLEGLGTRRRALTDIADTLVETLSGKLAKSAAESRLRGLVHRLRDVPHQL